MVIMALQMSPVAAHSENQLPCDYQPAVLLPEAAAETSSHQVGPFQCQHLECSSTEQMPLPPEQNPVPPDLRKFEQKVIPVRKEVAVVEKMMDVSLLVERIEAKRGPEIDDLKEGFVNEILTLLEVSQSSVIDGSNVGSSSEGLTYPGTHKSLSSLSPCLVDKVEQIVSAAAISSSSINLNDAQKDSGDAMRKSGPAWRSWSSNQSTMIFSRETNPPSATYADSVVCPLSTSAHSTLVASASAVSDEDYCDSKAPLIIKGSSHSSSTSAVFLQYPPIGPASNRHWGFPQGAVLRGGAGGTFVNNGGSSCGHPPASGSCGNGGTNNAANQGQWGAASSTANQRSSAASQRPSGTLHPGSPGSQVSNQQLPTGARKQQQPQEASDTTKNVVTGNVVQPSGSSLQGVWAAQLPSTRKIEEEWAKFQSNGDYSEDEFMALKISLKELKSKAQPSIERMLSIDRDLQKQKLVLNQLSLDRDVHFEKVLRLQQQRIDLAQQFMSKYSNASDGATPRISESTETIEISGPTEFLNGTAAELDEVLSSNPVSTVAVKSNLKRKPSEESRQPKKKGKGAESTVAKDAADASVPATTQDRPQNTADSRAILTDFFLLQHREVDVESDCRTLNTEAVNADPPLVGAKENPFLDGIDLTTNAGPSESGANVASVDDSGSAVYKNKQKTNSLTKTLAKAFQDIRTMADTLNLPQAIIDKAKELFKDVYNGKHYKGHSTHSIASACLYIASRQGKDVRTIDEICAISKIGIKEFRISFNLVLSALQISLEIITTSDFIPRFCCKLGLPNNVQIIASHIGRIAMDLDIVSGRCPISVAATAIYMASNASKQKLSQKEISVKTGVVDSTIRQCYALMYPCARDLFPQNFQLDLGLLPQPSKN